jgi:ATP synthase protein I
MADGKRQSDNAGRGPSSEADLARRLDRLSRTLDEESRERHSAGPAGQPKAGGGKSGYAFAFRMASEFVAGVLVGAGIGWLLDRAAGTSPWGLIVFLLLGFAAGVFNVVRASGEFAATEGRDGTGADGR